MGIKASWVDRSYTVSFHTELTSTTHPSVAMSTSDEAAPSRKRRSQAVLAGAKISAMSVTAPEQVPSESLKKKKTKSKDKSEKQKKSKHDSDDEEADHEEHDCFSECSCSASESEEDVSTSTKKKSPSDSMTSTFTYKKSDSDTAALATPSSRGDVEELRRQVAQLREVINNRGNTINEHRRTIEAKDQQIQLAASQLKAAVEKCKEETRSIAEIVHRRDAAIADLTDKVMEHICEKARLSEYCEKLKKSMEKLFKDGIFRQCATGATCVEHAIFLLHSSGTKPHYVCGECAIGLMKAAKGDEVVCPQCRFKIKGLKVEVPDGTVKSLDDYLVKEELIDAISFEELQKNFQEYDQLRSEVYSNIRTADLTRVLGNLPNRGLIGDLRVVFHNKREADIMHTALEEQKFYGDYRRPRLQLPPNPPPLPPPHPNPRPAAAAAAAAAPPVPRPGPPPNATVIEISHDDGDFVDDVDN